MEIIKTSVGKYLVKYKTINSSGIELTAEIKVKESSMDFVNRVNEIEGVTDATLVTFNGEYMS